MMCVMGEAIKTTQQHRQIHEHLCARMVLVELVVLISNSFEHNLRCAFLLPGFMAAERRFARQVKYHIAKQQLAVLHT